MSEQLYNNYFSNLIAYLCNDAIHLALEIVVIKRVSATGHQGVERNPQREHVRLQKTAAKCTGSVDKQKTAATCTGSVDQEKKAATCTGSVDNRKQ